MDDIIKISFYVEAQNMFRKISILEVKVDLNLRYDCNPELW